MTQPSDERRPQAAAAGEKSHVVADQSPVAALLADPATHGGEGVERFDTHASMVFLAGRRAYKVKRAVDFPYMDFSTLDKRRAACARELELNCRTAPELYLGLCPILRSPADALVLGPLQETGEPPAGGEVVEWAVVMRRFGQDALLDAMAERGGLDEALAGELAAAVAGFHAEAEPVDAGGAEALAWVIEENAQEFAECPELFAPAGVERLTAATRRALERVRELLDRRRARGLVRRCHGDLHLRNIVLLDGRPRLFDAIEFNDAIACIDVLYDLAFLLMDLDRRRLPVAANRLFNRYLQRRDDLEGLAAMPLFLSLRAAVRAKVEASAAASQSDPRAAERLREEAGAYLRAAADYLHPAPPRLLAVGGLSGTGKSTLARRLAPRLGAVPGAVVLRSDVLRKALFGVEEEARLPQRAYSAEAHARVYAAILERARRALDAGRAVIADAVFNRPEDRAAVERVAHEAGVPFVGLWLEAPPETLLQRVGGRGADASDATPEVVERQLRRDPGHVAWQRLDARAGPEALAAEAAARLAYSS